MNSQIKLKKKQQLLHILFLLIAAIVWGMGFVSQSVGADFLSPFSFMAIRNWIAVAFLSPVLVISGQIKKKNQSPEYSGKDIHGKKIYLLAGLTCGIALTMAAGSQQIGIGYTTAAKAGFITAMYVVLVPVISLFIGSRPSLVVWLCVCVGTFGLYLLCVGPEGIGGLNRGDLFLILCAFLFAVQILLVNYFLRYVDGLWLSYLQTFTVALIGTVLMLMIERPSLGAVRGALPALLYAGIMSSGVGYSLQIIGQEGLDPTVASLVMCLESVFSAIGGWLILGESLSARELLGCALMFAAIVVSQLPIGNRKAEE